MNLALFNTSTFLGSFLLERMDSAIYEINAKDSNYILNVSISDYTKYLYEKYKLTTPVLHEEKINVVSREIQIKSSNYSMYRDISDPYNSGYVNGTSITLIIPFDGDALLFIHRPTTYYTNPPTGVINNQELLISVEVVDKPLEYVKIELDKQKSVISEYLGWVEKEVKVYNQKLAQNINLQITARRDKQLKDSNLVASLGYPLREKSGVPKTYTVPVERKKIIPQPIASTESFVPEPTLDMENYDHILNVVNNMALVMERSPQAFKSMGEENIRQHFLVQLNGHYEGKATGETFNYKGKTDILIRENGKNIFISECKFWKGAKVITETIDQLLGYLSWRDTKTAIFLFNKNKELSNVLSQIPEIVKNHPKFKRKIKYNTETGFRYIFSHNSDSNRELYLTILVFDIPN